MNGIPPPRDGGEGITGESLGVGVSYALGRPEITGGITPLYGWGNGGGGGIYTPGGGAVPRRRGGTPRTLETPGGPGGPIKPGSNPTPGCGSKDY